MSSSTSSSKCHWTHCFHENYFFQTLLIGGIARLFPIEFDSPVRIIMAVASVVLFVFYHPAGSRYLHDKVLTIGGSLFSTCYLFTRSSIACTIAHCTFQVYSWWCTRKWRYDAPEEARNHRHVPLIFLLVGFNFIFTVIYPVPEFSMPILVYQGLLDGQFWLGNVCGFLTGLLLVGITKKMKTTWFIHPSRHQIALRNFKRSA